MKQIKQNEKGFTLVELVVVIAILVVLAALMVPRIIGSVEDARRSSAIGDARAIASEIATHNANKQQNPVEETRLLRVITEMLLELLPLEVHLV